MTDDDGLPKLRYIGSYDGGLSHLIIPREAFERAEAESALDRELAAAAKLAAIKAADEARIRNTRRARAARRFRSALQMFARTR
jgi:hypothetical protein